MAPSMKHTDDVDDDQRAIMRESGWRTMENKVSTLMLGWVMRDSRSNGASALEVVWSHMDESSATTRRILYLLTFRDPHEGIVFFPWRVVAKNFRYLLLLIVEDQALVQVLGQSSKFLDALIFLNGAIDFGSIQDEVVSVNMAQLVRFC